MRRRDLSKVLLASLASDVGVAAPAVATPAAADLQNALRARGAVRISVGTYHLTSKLQTLVQNDIAGDSRHDTVLLPNSFPDYVLEVGNGKPGPNAGRIARLKIYGAQSNLGCLHMNSLSHMWHLDDLIFAGGPCPALVVDNCWDSNYTNIDILGHVSPGGEPARTSAVIFKNGCNNIYCRGLRIEGALSGGIYLDGGPIYVMGGKIDDGFGRPQSAAAITIAATGVLFLDSFYFGGMLNQFHIDAAGSLRLGKVVLDGGTNSPAAINDRRAWSHINKVTHPNYSTAYGGPFLPGIDLGEAQFLRYHASVATETRAAVYSKIHPIRQVRHLAIQTNGTARGNTIGVTTSLRDAHDDLYKGSFLVRNTSGARRKILTSTAAGALVLEGIEPLAIDGNWSIEYCESHATPIRLANVWLDRGVSLFAVISNAVALTSAPEYVSEPRDAAYGTTKFKVAGSEIAPDHDLAGMFLVNNGSDEAYYIEYGVDTHGFIGVLYDRRAVLDVSHKFSIVAGHVPNSAAKGSRLVRQIATGVPVAPDLSRGDQFEITITQADPLVISSPVNGSPAPGQRITLTLINGAPAALGKITWAAAYSLAPWINPERGHNRSIDFRYDGKSWVEVARTPADVPN
jgi:hypothetical protein